MTSQQEDILKQAEEIDDEQDEEIQKVDRKFSKQMIEMTRVIKK